jgi:putative nucleotidyltransferase with HDIG domain
MSLGAPLLALISSFTRDLFQRERAATQLAEARSRMLEESFGITLGALGAALDLRDVETEGHSRRVAANARRIAEQLGGAGEDLQRIERGAFLHDIGKIGVPDAVLRKPGPLTDDEWAMMRRHAEIGARVLERIPFLQPAAELVAAHHERWDGTGYPYGLAGTDIPLGARIFAVVDAYDAMTSDRPYRRGVPHQFAVAEIEGNAGIQFDPLIVMVFRELAAAGLIEEGARREPGTVLAFAGRRWAA